MTSNKWAIKAYKHATECVPEECCGLVLSVNGKEIYWKCKNISSDYKEKSFVIDTLDWADGEDQGEVLAIVHSHPDGLFEFSEADKISCKYNDLPFYLVDPKSESIIKINPDDINLSLIHI